MTLTDLIRIASFLLGAVLLLNEFIVEQEPRIQGIVIGAVLVLAGLAVDGDHRRSDR